MICPACQGSCPPDAVYCPDCGTALYEFEWAAACGYLDETGYTTVPFRLQNETGLRVQPQALLRRDGTVLLEFNAHTQYLGSNGYLSQRVGPFHGPAQGEPVEDMVFVGRVEGGKKLEVRVPPLRISRPPEVAMRVGDAPAFPDPAHPVRVELRPSNGYRLWIELEVVNEACTELRDAYLEGEGGTQVKLTPWQVDAEGGRRAPALISRGDGRVCYALELPADRIAAWEDVAGSVNARLVVRVRGREDDPIACRVILARLRIPKLQVLVERPTDAGYAFLGAVSMVEGDLSPKRVEKGEIEHGLTQLTDGLRQALRNDNIVRQTLSDIQEGAEEHRRIVWNVPRGRSRFKRVAIDRAVPGDKNLEDRMCYVLRLHLDGKEVELVRCEREGIQNRRILEVPLPPLERDAGGELVLEYLYESLQATHRTRVERYRIEVRVFEAGPFPVPVGVDFGTTNSCVALNVPKLGMDGDFEPPRQTVDATVLLPLGPFGPDDLESGIVPTRVAIRNGGMLEWAQDDDTYVFTEFKRFIDKDTVRIRAGSEVIGRSPVELAETFLTELLRRAMEYLEERCITTSEMVELTCSFPTAFSEDQRTRIAEAYRRAVMRLDIPEERIEINNVDESLAAFFHERLTRQPGDDHDSAIFPGCFVSAPVAHDIIYNHLLVMVYDFGGGTTDVTLVLMKRDTQVGDWVAVELAAGGDAELGGKDVTEWLARHLFGNDEPTALQLAEQVKLRLGGDVRQFTRDVHPNSEAGIALSEEEEKRVLERIHEAGGEVLEELRARVREILDDVLEKGMKRLPTHVLGELARPVPFLVLLAGNAAKLNGFMDLMSEEVNRWVQLFGRSSLAPPRISLVGQPKACVAAGAYVLNGGLPEGTVERPYEPHVSYWLRLNVNAGAVQSGLPTRSWHGHRHVEVVREGSKPGETEHRYAPGKLGIGRGGKFVVLRKQGVNRYEAKRVPLDRVSLGQELVVRLDSDGQISLGWG